MLKKLAFFLFVSTLSLAQINGYPMVKPTAFEPYLQPPSPALAGLWLDTNPGIVWMGGNPTTIPVARVHLTASATNYVYVNLVTNTIQVNTTGFGSVIYPIAIVSTNATQTTTVQDVRPDVYGAGGGGGGSVNLEVNNVSNSDQTILNFVDASGIHFANPSGGIVTATVTGNIVPETVTTSLPSDSGSVNAYAACPSPTNPTLAKGLQIPFIPANTNTTASTFNLCAGGAVAIKKGSAALVSGDILVNTAITLVYDGTVWQDPTPYSTAATGVTSITTDSQSAITGPFTNAATDFQIKGLSQGSQTGTWPFLKNAAGTARFGDSAILTGNTLQLYGSGSANGFFLSDRVGDYVAGFAGGSGWPGIQIDVENGVGSGISLGASSIIFNVGASTYETFTAASHSFQNVPNFANANGFQIGSSYGLNGQCVVSTGTAVGFGNCATGSVATVGFTAGQTVQGSGGTSTNPVIALASPLIPPGNVQLTQLSTGSTALSITARTASPSGNLLLFQSSGLSALASVDVFGNAIFPTLTTNGTGAGAIAVSAGTDNGTACLAGLTNLSVTGRCIEGPASIGASWVETIPNTAPAAFSVLGVDAASGSPLEAAQHYIQTTDSSSPARIQTADTTVASATSGDILTTDGSGNSHDSGVNVSAISAATCATATITAPVTCGGVDQLGLNSAGTTTNNILSGTAPAGQYQISVYINATAACGGSPSGVLLTAKIAYTDSNGSVPAKAIVNLNGSTSLPSNTTGIVTFWQASPTTTLNVSSTYVTCTTLGGSGTEVVDAHYTLLRLR